MNRLAVIAVAAVVALASGFGLVKYVGDADERAAEGVETVGVLIASATVPEGTSFEDAMADGLIVASETIRSTLPPTAITDGGQLGGLVTSGVLRAGQTVVEGSFIDPDADGSSGPPTFADALPAGTVAVSFEAGGAAAVSNLISPGDKVNLLLTVPNAAELGLPDSGGPAVVHAFQDLEVIAIGAALAPAAGDETPVANPGAGAYTVAVAPRDAARVLFLTRQYEVSLVLVGPGNQPTRQNPVGRADAMPDTLVPEPAVSSAKEDQ